MPKLLIVTTVESTLRAFLIPYAQYFRAKGWTVDAMANGASASQECLDAFNHCYDVEWSRNPLAPKNFTKTPAYIRRIVEQNGYDIVHVHTPVAAFVTRYALQKLRKANKVKVAYTAHGFHFYKGGPLIRNLLFLMLEKIAACWTDHIVVINREDYDAAVRSLLPQNKVTYMPGIGIDFKKYSSRNVTDEEIKDIRQELGLQNDDVLMLMIAEFIPRKRHRDAIEALAMTTNNKIHLAFAGDGPLMEDMKRFALSKNVAGRVHFLGHRRDIPVLIASSRATLLTSQQEGLPRSVMESMVQGVPVIGTDIRGTRDLLENGCGILVPVGNIKELTKAMDLAAGEDVAMKEISTMAMNKCHGYDLLAVKKMHNELYAKLYNGD